MFKQVLISISVLVSFASVTQAQEDSHWSQKIAIDGSLTSRSVMAKGVASWTGNDNFSTGMLAKLGIHSQINEMLSTHLRFTTGATDVRGATWWGARLGSAGQKFPFSLDRAFFEFRPTDSLSIDLGKSPNRFWSPGWTELAFAYPWSQDGVNLMYKGGAEGLRHFVTLSHTSVIEYNSRDNLDDLTMTGVQLGANFTSGELRITPAFAIYSYQNVKGTAASEFGYDPDVSRVSGNSVTTMAGVSFFKHDYELAEAGIEMGYGSASLFYNYIQNTAIDDENVSYTAGFGIGRTTAPGDWSFSYHYRDVEVDAVFAPTHDSWFLDGGSGSLGHQTTIQYQLMPGMTISAQAQQGTKLGKAGGHYIMDIHAVF